MVSPATKPDELNAVFPGPVVKTSPYGLFTVLAVIVKAFAVIFFDTLDGCVNE